MDGSNGSGSGQSGGGRDNNKRHLHSALEAYKGSRVRGHCSNFYTDLESLQRQYTGCLKALSKGRVPSEDVENMQRLKQE
eukprot:238442-Rhodomonas_salina.1